MDLYLPDSNVSVINLSSIHPSILSSSVNCLSKVRSWRQRFQQGVPDFPFPGHINQLRLGDPEVFPVCQCRDIIPPPGPGSAPGPPPSWTCLEHLAREVASLPEGFLARCLNQLNWLLLTQRSSGSALSSSRMTELLTLSLRQMPGTLVRKPNSAFFALRCSKASAEQLKQLQPTASQSPHS